MLRLLFISLFILSAFLSPAIALFCGIVYALLFANPYPKPTKKLSKYLLQAAVVGLGFGMNLHQSLAAGREGILFTIVSVVGVLVCGWLIGRWIKLPPKLSYLISSGTAICGGSAIAAVAPIVKANDDETSLSLGTIFILNAIALFVFPLIGHALGLTEQQFGMWSAIAIHDTSSVVGAASSYGPQALEIATTVKLTRALWIIPLSLVSIFLFRSEGKHKISIPWFIFLFILAMVANTYLPIPETVQRVIYIASHKMLSATLFLIGSTLSVKTIKSVGIKPIVLGVSLWILISVVTLLVIL
ncbi:putative integral membrane protein (TIGR00698 family) [Parabacteroides sp. PFB2-12]|uniref:YeiH family protein n=1 Tax=unclassified Parabacteroides TaxID=2649774 RepID=UPI0024737950|nr:MULTISPECIES: putative sulfate exporter family transporter [unclassified Parabacteroides]MDH6343495.1 putative integral membrane protein (TIGR00698 family) [Parabacteroides sp. PM6-13]MDH6390905.1 putative integral membrane protein (TIGR00698 family) [Parabacteroides sp. PFB2-12]